MQVSWNGELSEEFKPTREVRQGDLLSPYLFVLCMERISQLIVKEVHEGRWNAIRLVKDGPPISHMFFTDDLVLFAKAFMDQVVLLDNMFRVFCDSSGQKISKQKSIVFFSRNVNQDRITTIGNDTGMVVTNDLGRYSWCSHHTW